MKVCKFGGTSMADAAQVSKSCDIILSDSERRVVVVSAPGKRDKTDTKVTDLLITCAREKLAGNSGEKELRRIVERYALIQRDLDLPEKVLADIKHDLQLCMESDKSSHAAYLDRMKAAGEDNCAKLVAAEFQKRGCKARYLNPREAGLLLTAQHGSAQLLPESYDNLAKIADYDGITVFPGFFGYTPEGQVVTFSRGGSDVTGAILAAAIKANVYENFTDVNFVYAADPKIVPNTEPIPEMTYREMRELSYAGFKVLHDEAIIPAIRNGVPICIKNTNAPDEPGTMIVLNRETTAGRVVGIAHNKGFCTISMSKYLMNREIGFGRKLLQIIEDEGLSFEHLPSGIDTLSIVLREDGMDEETEKRILDRIKIELGADANIEHGLALIMIAGEGMRYVVGVAAKATKALADAGVNIEMMDQGASEISMMFGVKGEDSEQAVRSLYASFFPWRK
ncbi:MAG: aspartate kinase [Lentisphaerae bacterium]|nr:aspartate kinase [Lentisphaerota bacterium]